MQVMGGFQGYGLRGVRMIALKMERCIYFWSLTSLGGSKKVGLKKNPFSDSSLIWLITVFSHLFASSHVFFSLRILDLKPCRRWLLWPECLEVGGWTWTAVVEILKWLDCYCSNTCTLIWTHIRWYGHIYVDMDTYTYVNVDMDTYTHVFVWSKRIIEKARSEVSFA